MKATTREKISEHFRHDWYHYLIVIVAAVLLTSFIGMILADVIPADKKVDIMMISKPCASYAFGYISDLMLEDETLGQYEQITFYHRGLDDAETSMQLPQWLYAAKGDVFILNGNNFKYLIEVGKAPGLLSLDEYIADGTLKLPEGMEADCYTVDGKVYGLPLSYLKMFNNFYPLETNPSRDDDLKKLYVGVASYSGNITGALQSIQWMLDNMLEPMDQKDFNSITDRYW